MLSYMALNRPEEARKIFQEAERHNLADYPYIYTWMYALAFVQADSAEMERQAAWAKGKSGIEGLLLSARSDTKAYFGHLQEARGLSLLASGSATDSGQMELSYLIQLNRAFRETECG